MQPIFRLQNTKLNNTSNFLYSYQDIVDMVKHEKADYKHFLNIRAFMEKDNYTQFTLTSLMEAINTECIQINLEPQHIYSAKPPPNISNCPIATAIRENKNFKSAIVVQNIYATPITNKIFKSREKEYPEHIHEFWESNTTILRAIANWDRNKRAYPGILFLSLTNNQSWYFPTGIIT